MEGQDLDQQMKEEKTTPVQEPSPSEALTLKIQQEKAEETFEDKTSTPTDSAPDDCKILAEIIAAHPDKADMINMLTEMGFRASLLAIVIPDSPTLDDALSLLQTIQEDGGEEESSSDDYPRLKMVIVARKDLKMGAGKLAAQVGHGVLAAYKRNLSMQNNDILMQWEYCGQPKVVLRADSELEMSQIKAKADSMNVVACTIRDAGRTQIAPNSLTVCAIGPADETTIDTITGSLKLY